MGSKDVTGYKLRPAAQQDLESIWLDTARRWSMEQAERYVRQLSADFVALVEFPEMERERVELTPPVRIKHSGSHIIIYQITDDHIDIIRIRYVREDWMSDPFGEAKS
jgi:toxin ParE1/3/4